MHGASHGQERSAAHPSEVTSWEETLAGGMPGSV